MNVDSDSAGVLILDDTSDLRRLYARLLERAEFTTFAAEDENDARKILEDFADQIRVVVLDVGTPEMRGLKLARYIFERSPGKMVVLSSRPPQKTSANSDAAQPNDEHKESNEKLLAVILGLVAGE